MLDQPMIGKAVQEQGAAAILPKTASPQQICDAIQPLLSDGPHRSAAGQLGAKIRAHDAAATAASHLATLRPTAPEPGQDRAHTG